MSLNHDGITASVYVAGVSVGCVNKQTKKWEGGFIRVPDHTLVMTITKRTPGKPDEVKVERPIETKRIFVEEAKQCRAAAPTRLSVLPHYLTFEFCKGEK
jgi:hypothetical protein